MCAYLSDDALETLGVSTKADGNRGDFISSCTYSDDVEHDFESMSREEIAALPGSLMLTLQDPDAVEASSRYSEDSTEMLSVRSRVPGLRISSGSYEDKVEVQTQVGLLSIQMWANGKTQDELRSALVGVAEHIVQRAND